MAVDSTNRAEGLLRPGGGGRLLASRPLARDLSFLTWTGLALALLLMVIVPLTTGVVATLGARAVAARQAEVGAARLLAGMADQQTGLLTYLKPAQPDSLLLYSQGQSEVTSSLAAIRAATAGTADAPQEAHVESAVADWQRWAEQVRANSVAAGLPVTDPGVTAEGRRLFAVFLAAEELLDTSLRMESSDAAAAMATWTALSVDVALGGSLLLGLGLVVFAHFVRRRVLAPLGELAEAAEGVARDGHASIPHARRADEIGELARALEGWQEASAVRTILVERAPVGLCRIAPDGRFLSANSALEAMLGCRRGTLTGQPFLARVHPDDRERAGRAFDRLFAEEIREYQVESRWQRQDGSLIWFSVIAHPVLGSDGRPESLVGILDDISERKLQAERAARIQRDLLPLAAPRLPGYDLAGICIAAQDVGGDFFDWVGSGGDGRLDLTVADVMGKGVGAALVMATLRAALRSAPASLGPAGRAQLVAESMTQGLTEEGMFSTLFHAQLDLASGHLRYVDAGHGHWLVRRADGQSAAPGVRSLPLGISDEAFREGQVQLDPGDMLLIYTDGLVEVGERTLSPDELADEMTECRDAEEAIGELLHRVDGQQADDVTVILLRRLARDQAPHADDLRGGAAAGMARAR